MSSDDLKAVACMLAAGRQRASAAPSTESAPSTNSVNKRWLVQKGHSFVQT